MMHKVEQISKLNQHIEQLERDLTDARHEIDACKNKTNHECENFAKEKSKFSESERTLKKQIEQFLLRISDQ